MQSALKTCEKSLLKYLSFPSVDNSYCDRISSLLDNAESWALHVVQAYTSAEVHSIKGSPGDIADDGIFSDNADKTVLEFLESFELGYIDWRNNPQRASKLYKPLSDDLKDKLMTRSDNYALMRKWLVSNYGRAAHILNDTVMDLGKRKKPASNDCSDRYLHVSAILAALQRLEKLICSNPSLGFELKECLYSRNLLTLLSKLLISQDYDEYIKEMTRRCLDWRNPLGPDTYECFRYICTMEKNMLEDVRDNGGFSNPQSAPPPSLSTGVIPWKGKSKGVFTTFDQSDPESDDDLITGVCTAAGHSDWIKPRAGHVPTFSSRFVNG